MENRNRRLAVGGRKLAKEKRFSELQTLFERIGHSIGDDRWEKRKGILMGLKSSDAAFIRYSQSAWALVYPELDKAPFYEYYILTFGGKAAVYERAWVLAMSLLSEYLEICLTNIPKRPLEVLHQSLTISKYLPCAIFLATSAHFSFKQCHLVLACHQIIK